MKHIKTALLRRSTKALAVLAAFVLLLGGSFGAAAATPATPQASVTHLTESIAPAKDRSPGTLAAISIRALWCGVSHDAVLTGTNSGAFDGQPVTVSIAEAGTGGSEFIGSARMRVNNVVVWGGNITVWVTVEWDNPLCVWLHYVGT